MLVCVHGYPDVLLGAMHKCASQPHDAHWSLLQLNVRYHEAPVQAPNKVQQYITQSDPIQLSPCHNQESKQGAPASPQPGRTDAYCKGW